MDIEFEAMTAQDITDRIAAFYLLFGKYPRVRVTSDVVDTTGAVIACSVAVEKDSQTFLVVQVLRGCFALLMLPTYETALVDIGKQENPVKVSLFV